ncbi:tyrosine-type recombinase/integrase [Bifidobacterium leontopitheci]|uniref:Integrase n=1 Tax=Bifidobacterium leontopitheci TaxID=2650774 RepID=A0A6I1GGK0_9BIFI|nr:tyrosine-type recombinase/integrase [Bifidobacterium leontopitheci]KAB7789812.1 integrase [Bifidobacterium leontopitheci]
MIGRRAELPDTWAQAVAGFIEYKTAAGLSAATLATRYNQLRRFAVAVDTPPERVDMRQITAQLAACKSQSTRKGLRNCLAGFFRWCKLTGLRDDDPCLMVPHVREPRPHPKPVPDDALAAALDRATDTERLILLLAAEYGLRRGEIARLHSDDVVPRGGGWALLVTGKGDKQRTIPLRDTMAERLRAAHGYVFPGRFGGHVEESYIGAHISPLLPDGYGVHKLRHRFATVAYAESRDMLGVSRALGHASTKVTEHYVALPDDSLCRVMDAAAVQGGEERVSPPPRREPEPPRRPNGDIRYRYDGAHGKITAGTTPEAVRMAVVLCLDLAMWRLDGRREFSVAAEAYAEGHGADGEGHARRSSPLRAAARRLAKAGVIDLVPNHKGRLEGVINQDAKTLCFLAQALAGELGGRR